MPDFHRPAPSPPGEPPQLFRQPPVVDNPIGQYSSNFISAGDHFGQAGQESITAAGFADWMEDQFGSESYGARRVFDLFTLLSITLAFALLFALMRLLEPALQAELPTTTFGLSLFVTSIALAQMLLVGGRKPRIASICAGPLVWQVVFGVLLMPSMIRQFDPTPLLWVYFTSAFGLPAGYLAGATVAGVFLVAEEFRQHYLNRFVPRKPPPTEDMWE